MGRRPITINDPGDAHELTFSCYKRLPLLASDGAKSVLLENLDKARRKHRFDVWAYVIMPEHVHLLVHPSQEIYSIEAFRKSLKQPTARELLRLLRERQPETAARLIVPGSSATPEYRFWQKGKGFDRNLFSARAIHAAINYIHANPVRRGLCESDVDYCWSSARSYAEVGEVGFRVDRCPVVKMIGSGG